MCINQKGIKDSLALFGTKAFVLTMKKLGLLILLSLTLTAFSQNQLPNKPIERVGTRLVLDGEVLTNEDLALLLDYEDYQSYCSAQKNNSMGDNGKGMFVVGLGGAIVGTASTIVGIHEKEKVALVAGVGLSIISYSLEAVGLPIWIVGKSICKSKISRIADHYNEELTKQQKKVSYTITPSLLNANLPYGNGIGYGATFSVRF